MDVFSQKLQLIYLKLFNEEIDTFCEALIDNKKFDKNKFELGSESENYKQFFLNRKTVLRRWLQKGISCTPDFQKSFHNYKLAQYQLQGIALFSLDDFKRNDNLSLFNEKIDKYLKNKKRTYIRTRYQYLYMYDDVHKKIDYYKITDWEKEKNQTLITLEKEQEQYRGTFYLSDEQNIFMTLRLYNTTCYLLFYETNDNSFPYIVGVSMGYSYQDNMVPRSQKVVFSQKKLNIKEHHLDFILNETEILSAVENRLNLHNKTIEVPINHLAKYAHKLKKYFDFFKTLSQKQYRQHFYYRLVFREFHSIKKIFTKISKEESYYVFNYPQAFLELLHTIETIKDISFQVVMQLNSETFLIQPNKESEKIKKKFLHLYKNSNIKTTIIFVIERNTTLDANNIYLLNQMHQNNIEVRLIEQEVIINSVDSLNFSFINLNDKRDFVLADPIRDSKDVYKLFIDELTMDEYRTDYQRFLEKSTVYNAED